MRPRSSFKAFLEVVKSRSMPQENAEMDAIHSLQIILRDSFEDAEASNSKVVVHSQLEELDLQGVDELSSVAREMVRLIKTTSAPIFTVDVEGCINGWNAKVAELTGLPVEDAMGKSLVRDLVYKEYQETVDRLLSCALQGNPLAYVSLCCPIYADEEDKNVEIKLRTFGLEDHKKAIYVVVNACFNKDYTNNIVGVCFVGQDVTGQKMKTPVAWNGILPWKSSLGGLERKSLEKCWLETDKFPFSFFDCDRKFIQALLTANKRVNKEGQEIKSPLSGIHFSNSLLEAIELTEDQKQFLETSAACERQMLKIIRDVDLESIEDGSTELEKAEFYLGSVINAVVSQARIQQVLADFLLNMVRHAPSDEGWVEIHVRLTLKQIFEGLTIIRTEFRANFTNNGVFVKDGGLRVEHVPENIKAHEQ
ncbi:hypothetical protein PTKIN_Ptkin10aG0007600 [Pterospermum kingtungense]